MAVTLPMGTAGTARSAAATRSAAARVAGAHLPASPLSARRAQPVSRQAPRTRASAADVKESKAAKTSTFEPPLYVSKTNTGQKERIVVLGSGWGAVSFLKALTPEQAEKYDIVVISPRNYFLYTPLLPAVATGTMEERSIVEPVRNIVLNKAKYFEAVAQDIDTESKQITCCFPKDAGFPEACFRVPYDQIVFAVGAVNNTFGIEGVKEHCMSFKSIDDANKLRQRISECFERAALPQTPEEERKRLLSFVVCGGGPTGVEVAAEMHDMMVADMYKLYPFLMKDVSIKVIELMDYVLSALDRKIGEYTGELFQRNGIDLMLNVRVTSVRDGHVTIQDKAGVDTEIPFGACIWATGIAMNPLVKRVQEQMADQSHFRCLVTDDNLQVKGSNGSMWAIGDAATADLKQANLYADELFAEADSNGDGVLTVEELSQILVKASDRFPHFEEYARFFNSKYAGSSGRFGGGLSLAFGKILGKDLSKCDSVFEGIEPTSAVSREQFAELLASIDKGLRGLPATAQVARQQGEYLAAVFAGNEIKASEPLPEAVQPFEYSHKGALAYVGTDSAVADLPLIGPLMGSGIGLLWKGFETYSQFSLKNKCLVALDWVRTKAFGRDISRV